MIIFSLLFVFTFFYVYVQNIIYKFFTSHDGGAIFVKGARVIALSTIAKMPFSTCLHLDKAGNSSSMLRKKQHAVPIEK